MSYPNSSYVSKSLTAEDMQKKQIQLEQLEKIEQICDKSANRLCTEIQHIRKNLEFNLCKLAFLRKLCTKNNLSSSGSKQEIIERLLDANVVIPT